MNLLNKSDLLPRLPRPVWVLQAGNVVNAVGYGLVLPFEIIYLHDIRGFATTTAGLILGVVMATATVAGPPAGALVDRVGGKPVVVAANLLSGLGYAGLAFVHHPWQAFACSVAAGVGTGSGFAAGLALMSGFVSGATRASAFALSRVALNLGLGLGALTGGFIVSTADLGSYQALYLLDAATFLVFASVVLILVPAVRPPAVEASEPAGDSFRQVLRARPLVRLVVANVVFTVVGFSLFGNILPPFAKSQMSVSGRGIGLAFLVNTTFIILAQLPIANLVFGRRRVGALAAMSGIWVVACLTVISGVYVSSGVAATGVIVLVGVIFAIGECIHAAVLGPTVADLAPPRLIGRYMSLVGLSTTAGLALGPVFGSALLALSPIGLWIVAAVLVAGAGASVLALQGQLPEHERHSEASPAGVEADARAATG